MFSPIFRWPAVQAINLSGAPDLGEGEWWPVADIDDAGLPTVFARAARQAVAVKENEA
jgi:A/G-specific adenine glycosylase